MTTGDVYMIYGQQHANKFQVEEGKYFITTTEYSNNFDGYVATVDKNLSEYKIPLWDYNVAMKGTYTFSSYDALLDFQKQLREYNNTNYLRVHECISSAVDGQISDSFDVNSGWHPGVYVPYVAPTPEPDPDQPKIINRLV